MSNEIVYMLGYGKARKKAIKIAFFYYFGRQGIATSEIMPLGQIPHH